MCGKTGDDREVWAILRLWRIFNSKKYKHLNGETSISTVPRRCAWQAFESVLHNCEVRLAFPLYLRCQFLNSSEMDI